MKRVIAVLLIGLLVAPPAYAGQKPGKPMDWQKAQKLKPGTEIVLTVTGSQPTKVRFLFADEATLVTLKSAAPKLPGGVQKSLFEIGAQGPGILNTGATFSAERLRVSQDGIFDHDRRLAGLAEVVQQTPRADVREILGPPSHRLRNILIGAAVAAGVIILILVGLEGGFL